MEGKAFNSYNGLFKYTGKLTVGKSGKINITGSVFDIQCEDGKLPCQFGVVGGSFYCSHASLTSLEGSPKKVFGEFDISTNQLTSLEHCPEFVGMDFVCYNNSNLTFADYFPKTIAGRLISDDGEMNEKFFNGLTKNRWESK